MIHHSSLRLGDIGYEPTPRQLSRARLLAKHTARPVAVRSWYDGDGNVVSQYAMPDGTFCTKAGQTKVIVLKDEPTTEEKGTE